MEKRLLGGCRVSVSKIPLPNNDVEYIIRGKGAVQFHHICTDKELKPSLLNANSFSIKKSDIDNCALSKTPLIEAIRRGLEEGAGVSTKR